MKTLKHTMIKRKASSQSVRRFRVATDTVEMHTGYSNSAERQLWLAFTTSASGGTRDTPGETDYRILIGTTEYAAIIKAMCDVDEGMTLSAMADELAARLKTRP